MKMFRPLSSAALAFSLLSSVTFAQTEPKLKPDFSNVANWQTVKKVLTLTPEHQAALQKNLFVVTPDNDYQPFYVYGNNDYLNLSSIVTTDNVLQICHVFFDSTLRHAEQNHLAKEAKKLAVAMLKQSIKRYQAVASTSLAAAALKNVAYFGVADRLIGGHEPIPAKAAAMVKSELAAITAHQGAAESAIVPYRLDYSQFIVRGHYGKSPLLGQYFRTMMWFGLVPLAVERRVGDHAEPQPDMIKQACLMVQDLYDSGAMSSWQRIYDVTSLYAGGSNDLTPAKWQAAVKPVLGWPQNLASLSNPAKVSDVYVAINALGRPKIVSKANQGGAEAGDIQLRLMGQRAIPDSIAFNRVTNADQRPWPTALDVAAVFGSKRAESILDARPAKYNPGGWQPYTIERNNMAEEIRGWKSADWNRNLYNGCLDLLRLSLAKPSTNEPRFMQSEAWADKSLTTSLAFWAYLRHDTLLYGQQTVAEMGDGDEVPPYVMGYVEPNVPFYRRAISFVDQLQRGLDHFGYTNETGHNIGGSKVYAANSFQTFRKTLAFLLSVSTRELSGGKLSKEEHTRIRHIEGELGEANMDIQLSGETYNVLTADDQDMAEVADVHSSNGQALEVGVGHADHLLAIVPIEGHLHLARGSVLSFYEFRVPASSRMTDHDWKQIVNAHKAPPRPEWMKSYYIDKSSRGKDQ